MVALRRIIAYVIDMGLVLTPVTFALGPLDVWLGKRLPAIWTVYAGFFSWVASMAVPVVVLGVSIGLLSWTPGKLMMFVLLTLTCTACDSGMGKSSRRKTALPSTWQ